MAGSRLIYVWGVDLPSRHSADIKLARIDIDQREICRGGRGKPGIVCDAGTVPHKCCERHPRDALKTRRMLVLVFIRLVSALKISPPGPGSLMSLPWSADEMEKTP